MVTLLLVSLVDDEKNTQKINEVRWPFQRPCGCAGAIRRASPNRARLGLHVEPLNADIGRLFAPYCPGTDGGDTTNTM